MEPSSVTHFDNEGVVEVEKGEMTRERGCPLAGPLRSEAPGLSEPFVRFALWMATLMHQSAVAHCCCQPPNPRVWKRISHHDAPVAARIIELKREGAALPKRVKYQCAVRKQQQYKWLM